jgi:CBS-domain-containing membrane protein
MRVGKLGLRIAARWPFTCLEAIPPVASQGSRNTSRGVARISSRPTLLLVGLMLFLLGTLKSRDVELLLSGTQQDFPVVDARAVVGILTRGDLLTALARQEQRAPVAQVMRRDFLVADASDMLDVTFQRLQGHECHTIPVVHRGDLVELLTMDNVREFLSVKAALEGRPARRELASA